MTTSQTTDWSQLHHAYGAAEDIPDLLEQLKNFPAENDWKTEPWFSLWSALYHQGDIYSASIAAVPHIVYTLSQAPRKATLSFYLLPASIAIADSANPVEVSPILRNSFTIALAVLGRIAAAEISTISDQHIAKAAQAAALVSQGAYQQAGALLEEDA